MPWQNAPDWRRKNVEHLASMLIEACHALEGYKGEGCPGRKETSTSRARKAELLCASKTPKMKATLLAICLLSSLVFAVMLNAEAAEDAAGGCCGRGWRRAVSAEEEAAAAAFAQAGAMEALE